MLGEILGWTEAQIRARDDRRLDTTAGRRLEDLLQRRCTGEPMAYILGRKEFYGRDFQVDSNVLIPRPETEHLIDEALDHLRSKEIEAPRILDLGTGSGCIAVTLACEFPDATVTATDISIGALGVAIGNAKSLGVERRVNFVAADLASCCRLGYFDLVVSNPPYVSEQAAGEMSAEVLDFEPHTALFADDHGRSVITALLEDAVRLRPEARVLIELGYDQGDWVEEAVRVRSYLGGPKLIRDLAGHSRVVGFSRTT